MKWKINFYSGESTSQPVKKWLLGLEIKTRAKIYKNLELLSEFNLTLKAPYVKPLEDKLYELRTKDPKGIYRIIYFAYKKQTFILLNGFTKKTQATPRKEIDLAKKRMEEVKNG